MNHKKQWNDLLLKLCTLTPPGKRQHALIRCLGILQHSKDLPLYALNPALEIPKNEAHVADFIDLIIEMCNPNLNMNPISVL